MAMMTEGCHRVATTSTERQGVDREADTHRIEWWIEQRNVRRHLKVEPLGADATLWV